MRTWTLAVVLVAACGGVQQPAREPDRTTTTAAVVHPGRVETSSIPREPQTPSAAAEELDVPVVPTRIEPPATGLDDGRIAGIAHAIDQMQMEQARLALGRAKDGRVRDLAQLLYDHHHAAEARWAMILSSLDITASPTATSAALEVRAPNALASLRGGSLQIDFDKAYVALQVREHKQMLDTIDEELAPSARAVQVQQWLLGFRAQVADDYARALALQQTLAN